jgi:hypothetical protein
LRAVVAGDHDDTRQEMAELALVEDNPPFSALRFPYAGIEAAIGALKQVGRRLSGIAERMRSACGRYRCGSGADPGN